MEKIYNTQLTPLAKNLRKNMTREESHLWYDFLSKYPIRFTRQKVFGHYIADFYCYKAKLVIEIDGSTHLSKEAQEYDKERTLFFNRYDIKVIRFFNGEICADFYRVCDDIDKIVNERINKKRNYKDGI